MQVHFPFFNIFFDDMLVGPNHELFVCDHFHYMEIILSYKYNTILRYGLR